jgi:holin-like protein
MQVLTGLAWLLLCQSAGEALTRLLQLGLLLLLAMLRLPSVRHSVGACADALLAHLSLLFVPVGVGVMTHLGVLSTHGLRLAVALVVSTWIGLAVTAMVLRGLLRDRAPATDDREPG